jgi:hypothetical protein
MGSAAMVGIFENTRLFSFRSATPKIFEKTVAIDSIAA